MTGQNFDWLWGNVHSSFGKVGSQNPGARKRCAERVAHIPDTAVQWILERIEDLTSMPQNLAKAILGAYQQWLDAHPHLIARELDYDPDCPWCMQGYLHCLEERQGSALWAKVVARCGHCSRGDYEGFPRITGFEAENRGLIVMPRGICPEEHLPKLVGVTAYRDESAREVVRQARERGPRSVMDSSSERYARMAHAPSATDAAF